MITVTPAMVAAAQEAFLAAWRRGHSLDLAVSEAVTAAVNFINRNYKDRKS